MTVRKNFLFDEGVARHLEEVARHEGKTQTQIAQEAIEERYRQIRRQKQIESLHKLADTPAAHIGDIEMKQMRTERAVRRG